MSFEVVVTRFAAQSRETPALLLERLLGLEPREARELTAKMPVVVVSRTTREHATLLADQLRRAGAEVQVIQADRRPQHAGASPKPEARRPAIREVYAARADEREVTSHTLASEPRGMKPRAAAVPDRTAQASAEGPPSTTMARPPPQESAAREPARAPLVTQPHAEAAPQQAAAQQLLALHAAAHQLAAQQRAPEPLSTSFDTGFGAAPRMPQGASAELSALAARGLGNVDLARFTTPDNQVTQATPAASTAFGSDPLFPGEPAAPEKTNALLDDFDDVINRPLDFGGPAAKPRKAATAADSELEGLFSGAPFRSAPRPKNDPPAAARAREPLPPQKSSRTVAETPTQEIVIYDSPKASHSGKLMKGALALLLLCLIGVVGAVFSDGDGGATPSAETQVGGALADGDSEQNKMHVLVRLAPNGVDRSMALVLRELVTGTHKVQMDVDGMPEDTQCLLVRTEDGHGTKRIRKLLRTGMRVPLHEAALAALAEHEASLRLALGQNEVRFKPLCLSVDLYKESLKSQADKP